MSRITSRNLHIGSQQQSGMALIVVLLFLVLIMVAGAIAIRQSRTDLNVATSDQAGTLTLNSSDSVLGYIEQLAESNDATLFSQTRGVFGYFLVDTNNKVGHQISFCYRPQRLTQMFERNEALTRIPGGGTQGKSDYFCDPDEAGDYTSGRNVSMTQVTAMGKVDTLSDNFAQAVTGTSAELLTNNVTPLIDLYSVSTLPGLSSAQQSQITGCLQRPVGDATNYGVNDGNMSDCLKAHGIPATALVEETLIANIVSDTYTPDGISRGFDCGNDANCQQATTATD